MAPNDQNAEDGSRARGQTDRKGGAAFFPPEARAAPLSLATRGARSGHVPEPRPNKADAFRDSALGYRWVEDHRLPIGLRGWTTTGYATGNLGWQVGGVTALPGSAGACDLHPPPRAVARVEPGAGATRRPGNRARPTRSSAPRAASCRPARTRPPRHSACAPASVSPAPRERPGQVELPVGSDSNPSARVSGPGPPCRARDERHRSRGTGCPSQTRPARRAGAGREPDHHPASPPMARTRRHGSRSPAGAPTSCRRSSHACDGSSRYQSRSSRATGQSSPTRVSVALNAGPGFSPDPLTPFRGTSRLVSGRRSRDPPANGGRVVTTQRHIQPMPPRTEKRPCGPVPRAYELRPAFVDQREPRNVRRSERESQREESATSRERRVTCRRNARQRRDGDATAVLPADGRPKILRDRDGRCEQRNRQRDRTKPSAAWRGLGEAGHHSAVPRRPPRRSIRRPGTGIRVASARGRRDTSSPATAAASSRSRRSARRAGGSPRPSARSRRARSWR